MSEFSIALINIASLRANFEGYISFMYRGGVYYGRDLAIPRLGKGRRSRVGLASNFPFSAPPCNGARSSPSRRVVRNLREIIAAIIRRVNQSTKDPRKLRKFRNYVAGHVRCKFIRASAAHAEYDLTW